MRIQRYAFGLFFVLGATAFGLSATPAHAAIITIVNVDGAGEGFNDPTPVPPVGGNPGTTIGQQRLNVFQAAANIWGGLLPSNVEIRVRSQFNPQSCTATSGVLGSAGPINIIRDFPGALFPATWYHVALANRLANSDQIPGTDDISATFNSSVGGASCLTVGWYYGLDGNEGTQIELLPVVLHELGHGLGFSTPTSGSSGAQNSGFPGVYDKFLLDLTTGMHWDAETAAQRAASAIACTKLVWDGANVVAAAPGRLGPLPLLRVNAPGGIAGDYTIGQAAFGPALTTGGLTGDVVLADDATGTTSDACEPIVNGAAMTGKIALVDRGTCTFVVKVKGCQNAGAIAVIVADNAAGCPPPDLGGGDPSITIPSVRVTQADGITLKAAIAGGLNVTLIKDPARNAGADPANHVFLYSPTPFASGSSVSHWDVSANPNLLMEPALSNDLHDDVDLTLPMFQDIGWFDGPVPALAAVGSVLARPDGVRIEWVSSAALTRSWIVYRREQGQAWSAIGTPTTYGQDLLVAEDRAVPPGYAYDYRLGSAGSNGIEEFSPDVWVSVPAGLSLQFSGTGQNPSSGRLTLAFTLPTDAPARLTVTNVAGRVVHAAELTDHVAGAHVLQMGPESRLSPGVYFIRLAQGGESVQKSAVVLQQ